MTVYTHREMHIIFKTIFKKYITWKLLYYNRFIISPDVADTNGPPWWNDSFSCSVYVAMHWHTHTHTCKDAHINTACETTIEHKACECISLPEAHNLVGIRQIAASVLHLSGVRVTDLVICAPIIGALDHNDIGARAAQLDRITLTWQLSTHHSHRHWSTT